MKRFGVTGLAMAGLIMGAVAADRPNVIFILADDLGYGDLSIFGQEKLLTPHIDRIGKEGMVFTQHYSGNTVCSPSRAVIMTGQHPGHVHCRGNVGSEDMIALDPEMVTLPRLFKNAGYATGAFGKWGLGVTCNEGAENPLTHGFDTFSGWKSQKIAHTYYPSSLVRDGKEIPLEEGTFVHDLVMADAFRFIEKNAKTDRPFFAYIPTAVPHAAMHAPPELHEKWRKVFPEFDSKIGNYGAGPGEKCPPVTNPIAGFAAMMENLDNQVGELFELLEKTGVVENTLILFASDNGTHREGGHDPDFWNSNGPFRGIKRDLYEGGIHTPFLAYWPKVIQPGIESDHISAFWDLLPTMADLIGQPLPEQADGISMAASFAGKPEKQKKHDCLYFEFTQGSNQTLFSQAVRKGPWKAVRLKKKDGWVTELYNLEHDIGEQKNMANQHPEKVKELKCLLEKMMYKKKANI